MGFRWPQTPFNWLKECKTADGANKNLHALMGVLCGVIADLFTGFVNELSLERPGNLMLLIRVCCGG